MKSLKRAKNGRKILPLKKLKPKGGDIVDLRDTTQISKNGNGGCYFIPVKYMRRLGWVAKTKDSRGTEVYTTVTDKGEIVLTPVEGTVLAKQTAKAS